MKRTKFPKGSRTRRGNLSLVTIDTPLQPLTKAKSGRPLKLTQQIQDRLVEALTMGNYYDSACKYAGISYDAFRSYMLKGEAGETEQLVEFYEAIKNAEATAELEIVRQWQKQIPGDWKACATFLERRFPDKWARRTAVELTGKGGGPLESASYYKPDLTKLSDEELRELEQLLSRAAGDAIAVSE